MIWRCIGFTTCASWLKLCEGDKNRMSVPLRAITNIEWEVGTPYLTIHVPGRRILVSVEPPMTNLLEQWGLI